MSVPRLRLTAATVACALTLGVTPPRVDAQAPPDTLIAIAGRVSDADGLPLEEVVIQVGGTDFTAITDVEGRYRMLLLDSAVGRSVAVTATYIGFIPAVDSIELVRGENEVDFLLRARPTDAAPGPSPHPPVEGIDVIGRDRGSTDGFDAENLRFDAFLDRLADGALELPDGTVAPFVDGRPPLVYLGREQVEDLSVLSGVDSGSIDEIVILSPGVGRTLYGPDGAYGVIAIALRNGARSRVGPRAPRVAAGRAATQFEPPSRAYRTSPCTIV